MADDPDGGVLELQLEWDEEEEVAILHPHITLATPEDVERWGVLLLEKLGELYDLVGGRFPLLVDMTTFVLKPRCVHAFAEVIVTEVRRRYVSAHARFGEQGSTRQAVAISAKKTGVDASIFDTKAAALADIRRQLARYSS